MTLLGIRLGPVFALLALVSLSDLAPLPGHGTALGGSRVATSTAANLSLSVVRVTSSTVTIVWGGLGGMDSLSVYVGPEPASIPNGRLPIQRLVARVPLTATRYTITGLAAATDVFIRVEAGGLGTNAHARTAGGPRATLDGPLREVHAYAPNILMMVLANPATQFDGTSLLIGNTGPAWQGGTWTVKRRGGRVIPVSAVYRHSVPVGQPSYTVGPASVGYNNVVDVDHRIFLVLTEPIGSPEWLSVWHTGDVRTALHVGIPFSDRYLETPVIQVNQVGYNPRATRRWAYVYGWMGDGGNLSLDGLSSASVVRDRLDPLAPKTTVLSGLTLAQRITDDADTAGGDVREIDLSSLPPAEGVRYRVRIPGVGVSWPTAVSEDAAFKAFYIVARGLFHNRWCGDLTGSTTLWSRPPDHCRAYFVTGVGGGINGAYDMVPSSTPQTNPRPLRGGHHDAGDFDIRPVHILVAQYLLRAYELSATKLTDGQLTLPESRNGIPDLLDEALWSVGGWQALQNSDGSVRPGAGTYRNPPYDFANLDPLPYWTYDPVAWHTANCAALFAQAAYLVRPFDATRSATLTTAARRAYAWATGHSAPKAYLMYAAGELARLTGESSYVTAFQNIWDSYAWGYGPIPALQYAPKMGFGAYQDPGQQNPMADYVMAFLLAYPDDPRSRAMVTDGTAAALTTRWSDRVANAVINSARAHRNGRTNFPIDWGGLTSTGRHVDTVYQALQFPGLSAQRHRDYFDALSLSADYVLGANPAGYVFITGLGTRYPQQALHTDSLAFALVDGLPGVPGIPVYGPVDGYPAPSYYRAQGAAYSPAYDDLPPALGICDTRACVRMNEFTVWEMQAPLAQLFTALVGPGMSPPAGWLPGGSEVLDTVPSHTAE